MPHKRVALRHLTSTYGKKDARDALNVGNIDRILQDMPETMRREVMESCHNGKHMGLSFFQKRPTRFLTNFVPCLEADNVDRHSVFYRQGDSAEAVYFLLQGKVGKYRDQGSLPISLVPAGTFFGEVEVFFPQPRLLTIVAEEHCESLKIQVIPFRAILRDFPDVHNELKSAAQDAMQNDIICTQALDAALSLKVKKEKSAERPAHAPGTPRSAARTERSGFTSGAPRSAPGTPREPQRASKSSSSKDNANPADEADTPNSDSDSESYEPLSKARGFRRQRPSRASGVPSRIPEDKEQQEDQKQDVVTKRTSERSLESHCSFLSIESRQETVGRRASERSFRSQDQEPVARRSSDRSCRSIESVQQPMSRLTSTRSWWSGSRQKQLPVGKTSSERSSGSSRFLQVPMGKSKSTRSHITGSTITPSESLEDASMPSHNLLRRGRPVAKGAPRLNESDKGSDAGEEARSKSPRPDPHGRSPSPRPDQHGSALPNHRSLGSVNSLPSTRRSLSFPASEKSPHDPQAPNWMEVTSMVRSLHEACEILSRRTDTISQRLALGSLNELDDSINHQH
eukprot:gnl/MRDRNA2_/MRDRNA2_135901_c0_seq1.p1 gnl/MRDRNA2_/MRDRNA2_135901_c0~~gnl/MRDRNA2_/MRDRNA2_135901_c0_seq1.p1  ORF type:complete len:612 (-),score=83.13 gnl/MRDRNA2_/MRDRNA2_135901_c0_seq1:6-1715(-)